MQNPMSSESAQQDVFDFLASIPSETYIYAMLGSIAASAVMFLLGRLHTALFIGQWAPTFVALGLFYKLLRQSGANVGQRTGEAHQQSSR